VRSILDVAPGETKRIPLRGGRCGEEYWRDPAGAIFTVRLGSVFVNVRQIPTLNGGLTAAEGGEA